MKGVFVCLPSSEPETAPLVLTSELLEVSERLSVFTMVLETTSTVQRIA
jgi:hypothetical protein